MAELKKHIYDENNGLHYTLVADCHIPDLKLSGDESRMNDLLSCEFNIDTGCVGLRYADGSRISIDCAAVENEVVDNTLGRNDKKYSYLLFRVCICVWLTIWTTKI